MSITQNKKIMQIGEKSLVVGVDIASETHYARAFDYRGIEVGKVFKFDNDSKGFTEFTVWMNDLKEKNIKTNIIVGAEPTGHYWFSLGEYLKKHGIKVVLVNPMHVKRTKELDDNHPSKTDWKDPKTIAKLVIDGRYLEPYIPEGIYAQLRIANENRLRITKELITVKNRLKRWLAIYFPEYKTVFGDWTCISSLIVLKNTPLPQDVLKTGVQGINKPWRDEKIRAVGVKRATTLYNAASVSVGVTEGTDAARYEISMLLDDYTRKAAQLEQMMTIVEELCLQVPNVDKLLNIKGIGISTVASFIAEAGDLGRFNSPKQIQKLAGLSIKENSSGKFKGQTTISKRGRKRLRTALFQVIMPLISNNKEFAALHKYFTERGKNPLKRKQSVIALSCKLIRVFYTLLKKGIEYDGQKLMNDIERNQVA